MTRNLLWAHFMSKFQQRTFFGHTKHGKYDKMSTRVKGHDVFRYSEWRRSSNVNVWSDYTNLTKNTLKRACREIAPNVMRDLILPVALYTYCALQQLYQYVAPFRHNTRYSDKERQAKDRLVARKKLHCLSWNVDKMEHNKKKISKSQRGVTTGLCLYIHSTEQ